MTEAVGESLFGSSRTHSDADVVAIVTLTLTVVNGNSSQNNMNGLAERTDQTTPGKRR